MIQLEITDDTDLSEKLEALKEDVIKTMPEFIEP